VRNKNIGAYGKSVVANAQATAAGVAIVLTAGATEDGVEVQGQSIDCQGELSGKLIISYLATLAEDKTLSFTVKEQQSANNSSWDTATVTQAATVAATGGSGGSNETGTVEFDLNLNAKKQYVRYNITPDLSATGTDTAVWSAAMFRGGSDVLPAA
jgi:hypothetical protein